MKIELLTDYTMPDGRVLKPGHRININDRIAVRLIEADLAVEAKPKPVPAVQQGYAPEIGQAIRRQEQLEALGVTQDDEPEDEIPQSEAEPCSDSNSKHQLEVEQIDDSNSKQQLGVEQCGGSNPPPQCEVEQHTTSTTDESE